MTVLPKQNGFLSASGSKQEYWCFLHDIMCTLIKNCPQYWTWWLAVISWASWVSLHEISHKEVTAPKTLWWLLWSLADCRSCLEFFMFVCKYLLTNWALARLEKVRLFQSCTFWNMLDFEGEIAPLLVCVALFTVSLQLGEQPDSVCRQARNIYSNYDCRSLLATKEFFVSGWRIHIFPHPQWLQTGL